jgi:alpha-tubulin suppressor-like RCC1 family protein
LNDGSIKCWGWNYSDWSCGGQLGLGDTQNRGDGPNEMGDNLPAINLGTGKTAAAIAAGVYHNCALLEDGSVKCWGCNHRGQLGLGHTQDRGDGPGEMGDNLPAIDLGAGKTVTAISAAQHTCALLNDDSLKCWGYNAGGLLGLGDTNHRGDQSNEMGDNLPAVDLGTGKTAIVVDAGWRHTCVRLTSGGMKCWGNNEWGVLGLGNTSPHGDGSNEMGDALPELDLGVVEPVVGFTVDAGQTCTLMGDGSIKCWGYNQFGGLGLGDTTHRGDNPGEMGSNLPFVTP